MVYTCNGILYSLKKGSPAIDNNKDEAWGCYAKWNKPITEDKYCTEEMENFLKTYSHPVLNQEEIDQLNTLITRSEIEYAIKTLLKNKSPGPEGFTGEFFQT